LLLIPCAFNSDKCDPKAADGVKSQIEEMVFGFMDEQDLGEIDCGQCRRLREWIEDNGYKSVESPEWIEYPPNSPDCVLLDVQGDHSKRSNSLNSSNFRFR
jgi:hypothetical protein